MNAVQEKNETQPVPVEKKIPDSTDWESYAADEAAWRQYHTIPSELHWIMTTPFFMGSVAF